MGDVADKYDQDPEREWRRLAQDPYHTLEFRVNMHYIREHLPPGGIVLDAGGGPGRYAIDLCRAGYKVVLLDASSGCIATAKEKLAAEPESVQHNARDWAVGDVRNLVGFASNVASSTFAVADREDLARTLGYKSEATLNAALNWFIKVGTDGFKTMVDLRKVERQLNILQSNLQRVLGKAVPWTKWPNEWAFRRGVPGFYREGMDANEKANCKGSGCSQGPS